MPKPIKGKKVNRYMPISTDNRSYTTYQGTSEKTGKTAVFVVPTEDFDAENAALVAKGQDPIVGHSQSFAIPSADAVEDIAILVPNPIGQLNAFNSGYSVQAANSARRLMKAVFAEDEKDRFVVSTGHYDLQAKIAEDLANINKRLTPQEKVLASVKEMGLTEDQLKALFANMLAAANAPAA